MQHGTAADVDLRYRGDRERERGEEEESEITGDFVGIEAT